MNSAFRRPFFGAGRGWGIVASGIKTGTPHVIRQLGRPDRRGDGLKMGLDD
jgi:hypothetical protein